MTPDERLDRYARLAVEVGINLQPGQFVRISGDPEHLPLVRAMAVWALSRLVSAGAFAAWRATRLPSETDEAVRDEWQHSDS